MYKDGYGSHGCVNLPPAKAKELYSLIHSGDVRGQPLVING